MRRGEVLAAAAALSSAAQWCEDFAPVFGGPAGESTDAWMDRLLEYGFAARIAPGQFDCDHAYSSWERCRWRTDRARRECDKCGDLQFRRLFRFDDTRAVGAHPAQRNVAEAA